MPWILCCFYRKHLKAQFKNLADHQRSELAKTGKVHLFILLHFPQRHSRIPPNQWSLTPHQWQKEKVGVQGKKKRKKILVPFLSDLVQKKWETAKKQLLIGHICTQKNTDHPAPPCQCCSYIKLMSISLTCQIKCLNFFPHYLHEQLLPGFHEDPHHTSIIPDEKHLRIR